MDIKVLGSGSSGNCYRISDSGSSLLLDAGLPFQKIQQGIDFKASELSGMLLSHEHGDHSKSVKDLMKAAVDCYMSKGTAKALGLIDSPDAGRANNHRLHLVRHSEVFSIKGFMVRSIQAKHDCAEPLGFFIKSNRTGERLLYITDTCYIPNRFAGMTDIMIEINHCRETLDANVDAGIIDPSLRNRIVSNHMGLATAIEFFKANDLSQVNQIILLHLSDSNSQAERILREVQRCTGKVVKIAQ